MGGSKLSFGTSEARMRRSSKTLPFPPPPLPLPKHPPKHNQPATPASPISNFQTRRYGVAQRVGRPPKNKARSTGVGAGKEKERERDKNRGLFTHESLVRTFGCSSSSSSASATNEMQTQTQTEQMTLLSLLTALPSLLHFPPGARNNKRDFVI
jgi:hypothetical protein